MKTVAWIIIAHQAVFQTIFFVKNTVLARRTGKRIRGKNKEVIAGIAFFAMFIFASLMMSIVDNPVGEVRLFSRSAALIIGLGLLGLNLAVSAASLVHLKESWRVGITEGQKTALITSGIYRFTRNPYFVSYLLMFVGYSVILQNLVLFGLAVLAFYPIHKMILAEERYLLSVHGHRYKAYKEKVPRYLLI